MLEIITVSISFLILIAYHVRLASRVRNEPLQTAIGIMNLSRRRWVESIMKDKRDILAVQTMRNWVMAATFLASTSILISLALINAAIRPLGIDEIATSLNLVGTANQTLFTVKLIVLLLLFFVSFFNFTIAIRYYNHAAVTINIEESPDAFSNMDRVAVTVNIAALHYTIGVRCFYTAVPISMWLFGPLWFLGSTFLLFIVLCRLDCSS